jgi:hypothetical protein
MRKLFQGIKYDAQFIRDHELQPGWYKVLKVFLLIGMIAGYFLIYGLSKTLIFLGSFFGLGLILHMIYRIKTEKFTRSWLDFKVMDIDGKLKYDRIGFYYYSAVIINGLISYILSQTFG